MRTHDEWLELDYERADEERREAVNEDLHDERDEKPEPPPVFDWEFM